MNIYQYTPPVRYLHRFYISDIKKKPLFLVTYKEATIQKVNEAMYEIEQGNIYAFFEVHEVRIYYVGSNPLFRLWFFLRRSDEITGRRKIHIIAKNSEYIQKEMQKHMTPKNTNGKANQQDDYFEPAMLDAFAKYYGTHPLEIFQKYTYSQLATFAQGAEFNANIQNEKPQRNNKFMKPLTKQEQQENEKLLEDLKKFL